MPGIVKYVIRIFVLHASIAKPLGESGKLQLTTDMAELEFSLNAFLADGSQSKRSGSLESIGEEYKALRAMRWASFLSLLPGPRRVLLTWRCTQTASVSGKCAFGLARAYRRPRAARRAPPYPRPITVATPTHASRLARGRVRTLGRRARARGGLVAHRWLHHALGETRSRWAGR